MTRAAPVSSLDSCIDRRFSAGLSREWPLAIAARRRGALSTGSGRRRIIGKRRMSHLSQRG